jgi:hypothetical protein
MRDLLLGNLTETASRPWMVQKWLTQHWGGNGSSRWLGALIVRRAAVDWYSALMAVYAPGGARAGRTSLL